MNTEKSDAINLTIQEYASLFVTKNRKPSIDWNRVEATLQNEMDWTYEGAEQVAALARDYGAFVLRNALALAITLGIEDGELGY